MRLFNSIKLLELRERIPELNDLETLNILTKLYLKPEAIKNLEQRILTINKETEIKKANFHKKIHELLVNHRNFIEMNFLTVNSVKSEVFEILVLSLDFVYLVKAILTSTPPLTLEYKLIHRTFNLVKCVLKKIQDLKELCKKLEGSKKKEMHVIVTQATENLIILQMFEDLLENKQLFEALSNEQTPSKTEKSKENFQQASCMKEEEALIFRFFEIYLSRFSASKQAQLRGDFRLAYSEKFWSLWNSSKNNAAEMLLKLNYLEGDGVVVAKENEKQEKVDLLMRNEQSRKNFNISLLASAQDPNLPVVYKEAFLNLKISKNEHLIEDMMERKLITSFQDEPSSLEDQKKLIHFRLKRNNNKLNNVVRNIPLLMLGSYPFHIKFSPDFYEGLKDLLHMKAFLSSHQSVNQIINPENSSQYAIKETELNIQVYDQFFHGNRYSAAIMGYLKILRTFVSCKMMKEKCYNLLLERISISYEKLKDWFNASKYGLLYLKYLAENGESTKNLEDLVQSRFLNNFFNLLKECQIPYTKEEVNYATFLICSKIQEKRKSGQKFMSELKSYPKPDRSDRLEQFIEKGGLDFSEKELVNFLTKSIMD